MADPLATGHTRKFEYVFVFTPIGAIGRLFYHPFKYVSAPFGPPDPVALGVKFSVPATMAPFTVDRNAHSPYFEYSDRFDFRYFRSIALTVNLRGRIMVCVYVS